MKQTTNEPNIRTLNHKYKQTTTYTSTHATHVFKVRLIPASRRMSAAANINKQANNHKLITAQLAKQEIQNIRRNIN